MGVLSNLAGVAKRSVTTSEGRKNLGRLAGAASTRLAKTAWDWSGAREVEMLDKAAGLTGKAYDYVKSNSDLEVTPVGGPKRQKRLPMSPRNNQKQGLVPQPLALPSGTVDKPSNQEQRERRRVSAETREKLRAASKQNAEQRALTRQQNIQAQRQREAVTHQTTIQERQLAVTVKDGGVQEQIRDELEAIHAIMARDGNPLLRRPGDKKDGGGILGSILGMAGSRIPGLGGLLAGGAKLGGRILGKVGGLAARVGGGLAGRAGGLFAKMGGIAGVGKVAKMAIPGLAGLAVPGIGGFAAGASGKAAAEVLDAAPGAAKPASGLAKKVGDVTDVVAKPVAEKAAVKTAGKSIGKAVLKKIPLIGALAGIGFGIQRAIKGDWTGAGMEVASGLAGTIPLAGTAVSVGLDGALAARDYMKEGDDAPAAGGDGGGLTPPPPGSPAALNPPDPARPMQTGAERREAFAGGLSPSRDNDGENPANRGENLAVPLVASSGASQSWREPRMRREEDVRVIDLLTTLSTAMLDRDKGIFVKPAKDVFGGVDDPFSQVAGQPGAAGQPGGPADASVYVKPSEKGAVDLSGPIPTADTSQVRVAPIGGGGFVPNSERQDSPRPYLGGGATPLPRQDISRALSRDPSIAAQAPNGPTTGVRMGGTAAPSSVGVKPPSAPVVVAKGAGKGFKGFGDDVDAHIKEASEKYGISEDVMRGFVKMEGGWTGAMSPTGAIGTGQFIQSTWDGLAKTKEGQDIGMTKIGNRFRKEDDPRRDKRTNTLATGLLAKQNAEILKKNGLEATGENLYMMHNIGPGVIQAMKGGKVSDATMLAMKQNGMKDGMTPQDFVAFQKQRYNSHYNQANAPEVIAQAKNSGVKNAPVAVAEAAAKTEKDPAAKGLVAPGLKAKPSTSVEQNAMALAASQKEADSKGAAAPVVVVAGGQGGGQQRQASSAAGDSKPGLVVRNNESSLSRVTDNLIARTIT